MGRILVVAALLIGAYVALSEQNSYSSMRLSGPGSGFTPSGTSGGSVGSATLGVAGRITN